MDQIGEDPNLSKYEHKQPKPALHKKNRERTIKNVKPKKKIPLSGFQNLNSSLCYIPGDRTKRGHFGNTVISSEVVDESL